MLIWIMYIYIYLFPFLWVQPFQEEAQQGRPVATPARAADEKELVETPAHENSVVEQKDQNTNAVETKEETPVEPTQVVPSPSAADPSDEEPETEKTDVLKAKATRKACDHGGPGVESGVYILSFFKI